MKAQQNAGPSKGEEGMLNSSRRRVYLATASILLTLGFAVGATAPAALATTYQLGSQSCPSGYDAYTRAGINQVGGVSLTIIHRQTNNGVTRMAGLYTQAGQSRSWSAGWQSFSASSVSDSDTRSKGCS